MIPDLQGYGRDRHEWDVYPAPKWCSKSAFRDGANKVQLPVAQAGRSAPVDECSSGAACQSLHLHGDRPGSRPVTCRTTARDVAVSFRGGLLTHCGQRHVQGQHECSGPRSTAEAWLGLPLNPRILLMTTYFAGLRFFSLPFRAAKEKQN